MVALVVAIALGGGLRSSLMPGDGPAWAHSRDYQWTSPREWTAVGPASTSSMHSAFSAAMYSLDHVLPGGAGTDEGAGTDAPRAPEWGGDQPGDQWTHKLDEPAYKRWAHSAKP